MALALHAQRFAATHGGTHRSIVIDHGIRPGSDAEAARVVARLEASGIPADYIRVQSPAPSTGIQEWARTRRYEHLLAEARRDRACLVVGQHASDQAETVMMRLARGSGLAGLAGMRPVTMREGVPVIRPLLGAGRAAIIASCHRHAIATEADPSNADHRFERVRRRGEIFAMDAAGMEASSGLSRLADAASAIDRALLRQLGLAGMPERLEAAQEIPREAESSAPQRRREQPSSFPESREHAAQQLPRDDRTSPGGSERGWEQIQKLIPTWWQSFGGQNELQTGQLEARKRAVLGQKSARINCRLGFGG